VPRTAAGSSWSFSYGANGNRVTRVLNGTPYTLVYDAENRLVQVKQGSTVLASYVYDGDGTLVKKVAGGQTTVYVGAHYEKNVTTGVVTKYYYLGSQRVAMRVGGTPTWIHGDHGSRRRELGVCQPDDEREPCGGRRDANASSATRTTRTGRRTGPRGRWGRTGGIQVSGRRRG